MTIAEEMYWTAVRATRAEYEHRVRLFVSGKLATCPCRMDMERNAIIYGFDFAIKAIVAEIDKERERAKAAERTIAKERAKAARLHPRNKERAKRVERTVAKERAI